ncbi:hypothetical protein E4414_04625 [Leptospira interrogans]|nr:hypothetical protein LIL_11629 [Leptospira interrogans serovar Linhai str. 56609]AJR15223.1 hypothetical protein LIL_12621 [Leptospira interrogans serovar Linhai str. 56609]QCO32438.1 hypothetical protein E4414_04625 [Leptospira interrogans]
MRKNFLKVVVPTISEIVYKIVICSSPGPTHFQTNLSFVIVPAIEYDRFNCYKLLSYQLW